MSQGTRDKGNHYEQMALRYLQQQGLQAVAQNFHCRWGEIDLILRAGDVLCFVEVKYRRSDAFGGIAYSIPVTKQRKIIRTALTFLDQNPAFSAFSYRFDALFISAAKSARAQENIEWIQDAFGAQGSQY